MISEKEIYKIISDAYFCWKQKCEKHKKVEENSLIPIAKAIYKRLKKG